ncbi:Ger(x)C family spore germination protein [Shimazuella kribbensis]|uniref:Ger(x)C family spore germination protein n=1 Tax=Shimazuella kribbensis TaxID=139808 RepID=UPI00040D70AB|nr:Ger(x)C family spore germination protein [Shimazuella kribbensis]
MNRKVKWIQILLFCLSYLFLTGCWDYKDVEDLHMIIGQSIDLAEPIEQEKDMIHRDWLQLTVQSVKPKGLSGQQNAGATMQKPYENLTSIGNSAIQTFNNIYSKTEHPFLSYHLKAVVLGEKLVKKVNMQKLLIEYSRAPEIRGSLLVFIGKGKAKDILEASNPTEVPIIKLIGLSQNHSVSTRIPPEMNLTQVEAKLASQSNLLLQTVEAKNKRMIIANGAIINGKTGKLVGFLNRKEIEGLNWLTSRAEVGVVKAIDTEKNKIVGYYFKNAKSKIRPHIQGDKVSFDVNIESNGSLEEDWFIPGDAFDNKFLHHAERLIEKQIKYIVMKTIHKLQKDYHTDVAGFGEQLRIEYPKEWKKMKSNWDQHFSQAPIKVNVKITITDYETKGTKMKKK